jgi:hypothetical protein
MADFYGLPLALLLIAAGVVVLFAATVIHWLLVILGAVVIAVGLYFLLTGGLGPI